MSVEYRPETGRGSGIDRLLRSPGMGRFMSGVGTYAAAAARQASTTPGQIAVSIGTGIDGRRAAFVTNQAADARFQEFGGGRGRRPASRPLGRALDAIRAADPNRRRGRSSR